MATVARKNGATYQRRCQLSHFPAYWLCRSLALFTVRFLWSLLCAECCSVEPCAKKRDPLFIVPSCNDCEGLDRMALAECESALCQCVHREYLLAAVEGRQGSRQRTNFQAQWMAQSGQVRPCTAIGMATNGYHRDTKKMLRRQPPAYSVHTSCMDILQPHSPPYFMTASSHPT